MNDLDLLSAWDFELPLDRIASQPLAARGDSRMLHVLSDGSCVDRRFQDLLDLLRPNDVLVFNDTKVLPARLEAQRATGGKVELLVVGGDQEGDWATDNGVFTAMLRSNRRVQLGETIVLRDAEGECTLTREADAGHGLAHLRFDGDLFALLHRFGRLPLPPYIEDQRRQRGEALVQDQDKERYQSVMASEEGAIAAPTASLHFDEAFLNAARARGVDTARLTLHVGIGTFRPVKSERLSEHAMHEELCELRPDVAAQLERARERGGRIIAVGTTVVRTLESFADADGRFAHGRRATAIFIRPGYRFRGTDALVTNFHLPKSTLLALVAAFSGYDATMAAYRHAVDAGYRFFSYGDAMFLEGNPVSPPDFASEKV